MCRNHSTALCVGITGRCLPATTAVSHCPFSANELRLRRDFVRASQLHMHAVAALLLLQAKRCPNVNQNIITHGCLSHSRTSQAGCPRTVSLLCPAASTT